MSMNGCELDRTSRDKVFVTGLLIRDDRVLDVARRSANLEVETVCSDKNWFQTHRYINVSYLCVNNHT